MYYKEHWNKDLIFFISNDDTFTKAYFRGFLNALNVKYETSGADEDICFAVYNNTEPAKLERIFMEMHRMNEENGTNIVTW